MNIFSEIERVTAVYRGSPLKAATASEASVHRCMDAACGVTTETVAAPERKRRCPVCDEIDRHSATCERRPDLQAAHNRAFGALVQQMVEFMDVWSYEDLLAAVHAADEIDLAKQAAIDDECVRAR